MSVCSVRLALVLGAIVTYVPPLRPKRVLRFPYLLSLGRLQSFRLGQFARSLRFGFARTVLGPGSLAVAAGDKVYSLLRIFFSSRARSFASSNRR